MLGLHVNQVRMKHYNDRHYSDIIIGLCIRRHACLFYHSDGCADNDIRLQGGNSLIEGRVEICQNKRWKIISDADWTSSDASVVCRQLGISDTGMYE